MNSRLPCETRAWTTSRALSTNWTRRGVETGEFKREAQALRQALAEMQRQQQLIDSFVKIKEETGAAGKAMAEAQANAQRLGRELAAIDAPTKKQTEEFSRAREAVSQTKDAYQAAQLRLQAMRGTLAENNIETTGGGKTKGGGRTAEDTGGGGARGPVPVDMPQRLLGPIILNAYGICQARALD